MLKQQCSSKCSDCAVAGIVVHGTREGVHTAGGEQSPSHRQTKGQTGHGQWQLRHFPRGPSFSQASKQASCEERFLLFFTAYKQAMGGQNCGNGVEARL